jgi:plasmid stabilization system protein ParE
MVPERNQEDIREVVVRRFRVVYRLRSETVEIATVFRGSQEFPEQL